jgi:hypothetical protein
MESFKVNTSTLQWLKDKLGLTVAINGVELTLLDKQNSVITEIDLEDLLSSKDGLYLFDENEQCTHLYDILIYDMKVHIEQDKDETEQNLIDYVKLCKKIKKSLKEHKKQMYT